MASSRQITITSQRRPDSPDDGESSPRSAEPSPPRPAVTRRSVIGNQRMRDAGLARRSRMGMVNRIRSQTPVAARTEANSHEVISSNNNGNTNSNGNGNGNGNGNADGHNQASNNSSMDNHSSSADATRAQLSFDNDHRGGLQATLSTNVGRNNSRRYGRDVAWYERFLPEFVLNVTAPLTGYENQLDSDIEDEIDNQHEFELLERQRLRRNGRIRRRLAGFLLVAAAASALIYARGRITRRLGVHAAVSSVAGKIENGINRIQDKFNGNN